MKFNIDDYPGNYVMHLATPEESIDFSRVLDGLGKKWVSGHSYLELSYWDDYKHNICYSFNAGMYDNIERYRDHGYIILEWSDFMDKKFTKADLKDGDVCIQRNSGVNIVNLNATMFMAKNGWNDMNDLNDDLVCKNDYYSEFDIVRVYRPTKKYMCQFDKKVYTQGDLVFDRDRDEPVKMTFAEVCEIASNAIGKNIEIVR